MPRCPLLIDRLLAKVEQQPDSDAAVFSKDDATFAKFA